MLKRIISASCALAISLAAFGAFGISAGADEARLEVAEGSSVVIDRENMLIRSVYGIPSVEELRGQFSSPADISVTASGEEVTGLVPGGAQLKAGGETFTVAISGDLNGDASLNAKDISRMMRIVVGYESADATGCFDLNGDSCDNAKDVAQLLKYLAGWNVSLGAAETYFTLQPQRASDEDDSVLMFFGDNLTKRDRYGYDYTEDVSDVLSLAKNEIEFTQMFIVPTFDTEEVTAEVTDFVSADGHTMKSDILSEYYFDVKDAEAGFEAGGEEYVDFVSYPDAIIPGSIPIKLTSGYQQGYVVKAFSTPDTAPGRYRATVTVKVGDAKIKTAFVYADVWDFALSEKTACATAFGMGRYNIYSSHNQYEDDGGALYRTYYDYMLENRVCPYFLPAKVLSEEANAYLDNPRVSAFMVDGRNAIYGEMTDEELEKAHEKLSANPEWFNKHYFYFVDEPQNYAMVEDAIASAKRLKEHFPGYRLTIPLDWNHVEDGKEFCEALEGYCTLWCPESCWFTPWDADFPGARVIFDKATVDRKGTAEERFGGYVENGDELWWYVCVYPTYPYANFFSNYQGNFTRCLFWQQYMYDVDGLLYWSVDNWYGSSAWHTMDLRDRNGDGRLIYCGQKYQLKQPMGTIRLEQIRDGIEDFQYLTMIEEKFGRAVADEYVARITTGIADFTHDPDVLRQVRNEMGDLLETAE